MNRKINIFANLDWITIILYLILVFLGWINIYAAIYNEEHQNIFDFSQRYGKQLIWIFASLFLSFIVIIIDNKFYSVFGYIIYVFVILLLIAVLFFGKEVNGARSWFQLGSIRFQPAEFAKLATTLAFAKYLSDVKIHELYKPKNIFTLLGIIFIPAILILMQNDTGSALVYASFIIVLYREGLSFSILLLLLFIIIIFIFSLIFTKIFILIFLLSISLILFYIYKKNIKETLIAFYIFISIIIFSWSINEIFVLEFSIYSVLLFSTIISFISFLTLSFILKLPFVFWISVFLFSFLSLSYSVDYVFNNVLEEHHRHRINDVLGIESDPQGAGYNVRQSLIAIGSGGLTGKGFLQGTQTKYNFVPEQDTDFIFCTVGEEWGFVGTAVVISLFFVLLLRLIFLAERQNNRFNKIFGYGVVSILFFHIAINIGMTIGLTPVIGIPLPFFSYGGSSLWSFTILIFIFLRLDISRLVEL